MTQSPPCLVQWPTDPTAGDMMPGYVRPDHRCDLPAAHVSSGQPHSCACGAMAAVRDLEDAQ